MNGNSTWHIIHESFGSEKPCGVHVISWSVTDNAEEGLNANTSIETLELINTVRDELKSKKKEENSTKLRMVRIVAVTSFTLDLAVGRL